MVFGHNTNIVLGTITYHVQTEDRGEAHAMIDTTVYYRGRVLHRRTNSYFDLLPMDADRQLALKLRLDEQHRAVLEEMRSGVIQLAIPLVAEPAASSAPTPKKTAVETPAADVLSIAPVPRKLRVELVNANSWLSGRHAQLRISVKDENGGPVVNARVEVEIEGSADPHVYAIESGSDGQAQIDFAMPRMAGPEAVLVIRAEEKDGKGHLRFALRAKSKVPTV